MTDELLISLTANKPAFDLELTTEAMERLSAYYKILLEHNALLHLVAPCSAEEFATRHILESLTLLKHLPADSVFADIGSGGGLPAIPCLIVRGDLKARLIESKEKKAEFLTTTLDWLGLAARSEVIAKQFSETDPGHAAFLTCRALDKFPDRLHRLVKWSQNRGLLFFGGEQLEKRLKEIGVEAERELMPLSERRYLLISTPVK